MADNFDVTAGAGTTIRAVEKSSKKTQVVALDLGGSGAESLLTTSLPVTPAATESHLGAMGGHTACGDVVISMTTHANYVAGDFIGVDATPLSFAGCARVNAGTGMVVGDILIDYALQSIAGELWLFDATVTPPSDSAAWTISDADSVKCIGVIPFNTYYASALNSVCPVGNLTIPFKCGAGATTLFGCFVTRGAPTYASGDLTVRLRVIQD
jgi:hypothetical protein